MTTESGKQAARELLDAHERLTGPIQKEAIPPIPRLSEMMEGQCYVSVLQSWYAANYGL